MSATERWVVRCDDYTSPTLYKTREAAQAAIARITECRKPHTVEPKR